MMPSPTRVLPCAAPHASGSQPKGTIAETVEQHVPPVSAQAKNRLMPASLEQEGTKRVIVLCRGRHRADSLCQRLHKEGFPRPHPWQSQRRRLWPQRQATGIQAPKSRRHPGDRGSRRR